MERNWWRIITPCTFGITLSLILVVVGQIEGGYGDLAAIVFLPLAFILATIDVLLRLFLKQEQTIALWITELVIIIITISLLATVLH